jgi:hypothetical protein
MNPTPSKAARSFRLIFRSFRRYPLLKIRAGRRAERHADADD